MGLGFVLTKRGIEARGLETCRGRLSLRRVGTVGVVEGLESCGVCEPEGTEGSEDDEGEGISKDPLNIVVSTYQERAVEKGVD